MRHIIIIVFVCIIVCGCRTKKPVVSVPVESHTIIRERLVEVPIAADSALMTAYLECDSNFNVLLRRFDEQKSVKISTALNLDDNGKLSYKVVRVRDTVYIPARDSIVYKEIAIPVSVPIEVNQLTGFQHFQIWAGRCLLIIVAIGLFCMYLKVK